MGLYPLHIGKARLARLSALRHAHPRLRALAQLRHLAQPGNRGPSAALRRETKESPESTQIRRIPRSSIALATNLHPHQHSPRSRLEITLRHTRGAQFVAESRQHRVIVDQPAEDGATDHGMSPAELLLVSLGSCMGQYVGQYLGLRGLSSEGLLVRVSAERSTRPLRLNEFRVEVIAPALTERQLRALEKSLATAGLVHGAISRENVIRVTARSMLARDVTD
jgi:putative redox protein